MGAEILPDALPDRMVLWKQGEGGGFCAPEPSLCAVDDTVLLIDVDLPNPKAASEGLRATVTFGLFPLPSCGLAGAVIARARGRFSC